MNEEAPRGAQALDALSETSPPGKLRLTTSARIDALVQAATQVVPAHGRLVEIGYDRGAIVLRVLQACPDIRAIGSEILRDAGHAGGPLRRLASRLELRTGDGLAPLAKHEVSLVIIAGMGGRTIAELLTRDPELTRSISTFVLCPSHLEAEIRPALTALGYGPTHERLAVERDRYYEIIVAQRLATPEGDPMRAAWGPRLFASNDPLLRPFLEDTKRRFRAAFAENLRSYLTSDLKAALGTKLACLDAAIAAATKPTT